MEDFGCIWELNIQDLLLNWVQEITKREKSRMFPALCWTEWTAGLVKDGKFGLEQVWFDILIKHPSWNVEKMVWYQSLNLRGNFRTGAMHLEVVSLWRVYKAMWLTKITKEENVAKEELGWNPGAHLHWVRLKEEVREVGGNPGEWVVTRKNKYYFISFCFLTIETYCLKLDKGNCSSRPVLLNFRIERVFKMLRPRPHSG